MSGQVREGLRPLATIVEAAFEATRGRATVLTISLVVEAVGTAATAYLVKRVVDAAVLGDDRAFTDAIVYVAVWLFSSAAGHLWLVGQWDVGDRVGEHIHHRLLHAIARAPGLEHLERQDVAEQVAFVKQRTYLPMNAVGYLGHALRGVVSLIATLVLLASVDATLLLVTLLLIPALVFDARAARDAEQRLFGAVPDERFQSKYLGYGTSPGVAAEVRVFGLGPLIQQRYREHATRAMRIRLRARARYLRVDLLSAVTQGVALAAAVGWAVRLAAQGRATVGDVVMTVSLVMTLSNLLLFGLGQVATFLGQISGMLRTYLALLDYESPVIVLPPSEAVGPPAVIQRAVGLRNVSFTYPGTECPVLRDVTLDIPAGTSVAIVGENGAGKTSLVKLLCRFYDPDEGAILVDGVDLRALDLEAWRSRSTAVFQDFVHFKLLTRENVGLGDLPRVEDGEAVASATRRAGADGVVQQLPKGLETQLGREFPEGADLSTGQRQRLALARGAMRERPALVILDEPTASLDAEAEAEVFRRFIELARAGDGDERPITVLVSHRFSTVRMADLIVVLHESRVEACGSHAELMAQGGRYAELYTLQAQRYRD